jgi:integrase
MTKRRKRDYSTGGISERGAGVFRLSYRKGTRRLFETFRGTRDAAKARLDELRVSISKHEHIDPHRLTVSQWIEHWIAIGCPGKQRRKAGRRAIKRYDQLLRCHIVPVLGERPLQQLEATEIDQLFAAMENAVHERTRLHVFNTLNACLAAAVRTRRLKHNPVDDVAKKPHPGEADHGAVLDAGQLRDLLETFKGSPLYAIVAVAVGTGARRNEILGLQWSDLDTEKKTLRIERAIDEDAKHGLKGPKKDSHKRKIAIDGDLIAVLVAEREKHLRLVAGVPDGAAAVDISLVKLPAGALMFPSPEGENLDLTRLRDPRAVSRGFRRRTIKLAKKLGIPRLRFHDIRGSHETLLLDAGAPVHIVAARCGHDPAELLKSYAKRTAEADAAAAATIGKLLGSGQ